MEAAKFRVALVGAGDISAYHLKAWQAVPGVELAAICDLQIDRANLRAAEFGIARVFTDAREMVAEIRPDALDVATWDRHDLLVDLAAEYGIACLCQKPLMPDLESAEALLARTLPRIRLMVNENRRFSPPFMKAREWIAKGWLGELRQCHMTMQRSGLMKGPDGIRPAVARSPNMGRDPRVLIGSVFTHQLDVLRSLLGELEVLAARALYTEADIPGDTVASLLMETDRHVPVLLSGSLVSPGFGVAVSDRLELIGSRSTIILDGDRLSIIGTHNEEVVFDPAQNYQTCFDVAMRHFVDCMRSGAPFETDATDNIRTVRLVEDAYRLAGDTRRPS